MASSSLTREPLVTTTNNSNSNPSPPPRPQLQPRPLKGDQALPPNHVTLSSSSSLPGQDRPLRRKATYHDLPNLDSSESYPSKHDSLYDALLDEEGSSSYLQTYYYYLTGHEWEQRQEHTPHRLSPITEKSSRATLIPKDVNDTAIDPDNSGPPHQPPGQSSSSRISSTSQRTPRFTFPPRRRYLRSSRHRVCFSTSDLPPSSFSFSMISKEQQGSGRSQTYLPLLPAQLPDAHEPPRPPPYRAPTPPNLPSFGKPEACAYRLPPPSSAASVLGPRLLPPLSPSKGSSLAAAASGGASGAEVARTMTRTQRLVQLGKRFAMPGSPWSVTATTTNAVDMTKGKVVRVPDPNDDQNEEEDSPEMREWRRQTRDLPRGCVMRGDDGTLVRGRWVPAASGHFGPGAARGGGGGRGPAVGAWVEERRQIAGQGGTGARGSGGMRRTGGMTQRRAEERRKQRKRGDRNGKKKKKKMMGGGGIEQWMAVWRRVRMVGEGKIKSWGKWDCCCGL